MTEKKEVSVGTANTRSPEWVRIINRYNKPVLSKSIWQIINSLGPYLILWYLMVLSLQVSYLLTLGLSLLAAGFLVRMFIIFHDCGHGSFFIFLRANRIVGTILGSLAFTPYQRWHKGHAIHHSTVGNLDKRGIGDVRTLTVEEYKELSPGKKRAYRLYRHPLFLIVLAPFLLFVIGMRLTRRSMGRTEKKSVYITNLILALTAALMTLLIGWKAFLLIQLPVIYFASVAGVWLFYVQHQFDEVIWTRQDEWDYMTMALEGSSYLKLPRVLQWFSGNIGYHHIHHLSPRIPNYFLEKCHRENDLFGYIKPVTFIPSLRTMRLKLWDEQSRKLVSFRHQKQPVPVAVT